MTEIEHECVRRIAKTKGLPEEQVGLDTTLESIAVDSLDRVSLSFDLEEQYGVDIPESKLNSIRTVRDVATAVEEALAAKAGKAERGEAGAA